ncbi:MAG: hypothetical protein KJS97_16020, partial [Alphaproteobacteria bacterium]|nr:hypothetical protein [Alphaproteobacteria bacterium]
MGNAARQIFQEPTGRRWRLLRRVAAVAGAIVAVLILALAFDAVAPPRLQPTPLRLVARSLKPSPPPRAVA